MPKKFSFADAALNVTLAAMAAAAAVLFCVYIFHGTVRREEPAEPIVIGADETEPPVTTVTVTEHTTVTTTAAASETTPEPAVPYGNYDSSFFDDALFIGDSLSVGLINYEFLKPENVFAQAGLNPSSITKTDIDGVTVYQKAAEFDPRYICIMLGTNGLSYQTSEDMAEKMGDLIDDLSRICPDAKIALISIPPVTKAHEEEKPETVALVVEYNAHIKRLAEEKSVAFADAFELLRDETGYLADDYAEQDGLHLKIHAYPVILNAVENALIEYYGLEIPRETEAPESVSGTESTEAAQSPGVTVPDTSASVPAMTVTAAATTAAAEAPAAASAAPAAETTVSPAAESTAETSPAAEDSTGIVIEIENLD